MASDVSSPGSAATVAPSDAVLSPVMPATDDTAYKLLGQYPTGSPSWDSANGVMTSAEPDGEDDEPAEMFTPSQYTWNLVMGITASAVFVLVTAAVLFGLIAFKRYMKRRNRTLSADTGVFSPRRGSKAGLDMIDNAVVLTSHRPLQRSGSIRKQFQRFLTR